MKEIVSSKVFVLGLDGASLNILLPAIQKGLLPNLGMLFKKGRYGELKTTIPPYTCPAWVTSITGVNPGNHSVIDFFIDFDFETMTPHFASSKNIKAIPIWDILYEHKKYWY